jgi:glycosyltransferase involved in cell wall biosynthesis
LFQDFAQVIEPLVSIVTPSFRSFRFVAETIESVKQQDYLRLEHIIVDGNSDDGTLDILKGYPHLTWISEPDNGQSQALNKGFRMAKGEIIGWLNADDTYNPGAVSRSAQFLLENPDVDAVYSDMQIVDEHGLPVMLTVSKPFDLITLFTENFMRQPTVFMRRHVIEELGGVDESLHYCMDRELWLRMGCRYKMAYIPNFVSANLRICRGTKTFEHQPSFHVEWRGVVERSLNDLGYRQVPVRVKRIAIEQAQVRFLVAKMEAALRSQDMGSWLSHFFLLLTRHWKYMLNYPLKKLSAVYRSPNP